MANDDSPPVGGGSRLLGTNQLQSSLDKLTTAVQGLASKMGPGTGWAGSGASFSNSPNLNQVATGGNGSTNSPFGNNGASAAGSYLPAPVGTFPSPTGMGPPSGPPTTLNQMSSGGNAGWGAALGGAAGAVAGSSLFSNLGAAASAGGGQLGTMSGISAYLQQGSIYGGSRTGMMNSAGFGTTLNDIANSANDAAQGQALINYASGAYGTQNALSRGITGAANMVGFLNPTLGYTGSAALGQQLYSQGMSMQMLSMGYGLTPRTMRGGTNSASSINQAILQRTFGGKSVNQTSFNASAAIGGKLNYNLQALGLSGTDLTNMESMLSAQNKLANAGYSTNQITGIFNGAAQGKGSSLSALSGVGINTNSILQTLKNKTAVSTQRSGEEEGGYQSGLATSVSLLNKFNDAINKLLQGPLGKLVGYGGGFMGGMSGGGLLGGAESAIGGLASGGLMGLGKTIIGNVFGGGAAAPGGGGGSTQSSKGGSKLSSGVSGAAKAAVGWARQEIGVPYVWGGEQPGVGFDCSGLTQWSYGQAGVKIPRTSQQQWAALSRGHSIPLNQVQEGDLLFTAGSDGTYNAPGHVAMMTSNNTLIQAEQTGTNIMLTPYNPKQWDHAARPTGPGVAGMGPSGSSGAGATSSGMAMASGFGGYTDSGMLGSQNEADAISGALSGGGGYMSGFLGNTGYTGSTGSSSVSSGSSAGQAPTNVSGNVALGKQLAAKRGWTGTQWNDLYALWQRESGWSTTATNPSSGAYGIPQALPASKMASAGANWRTSAQTQETWGEDYIAGRYKNPAGAWQHEQAFGWYARGTGNANPGMAIVGENGPEAINLGRGGQSIMTAGQTAGLLAAIQSGQNRAIGGGGLSVNVTVMAGGITMHGGATGAASDVSSSAAEIGQAIGAYLAEDAMVKKIMAGVSN